MLGKQKMYFIDRIRKKQMLLLAFGAFLLLLMYLSNVSNICTIWEMSDEGGYLFNAALVTNSPWKEMFSNSTAYYGYGYSILLIPLFLLCKSGSQLIQGVVIINIVLVILTYFMQVYLMQRLFEKVREELWIIASFTLALYPYTVCNSFKIFPEVFLSFLLWLIAVLLYKAVRSNCVGYYILMSLVSVYIVFTHTRAIVVLGITVVLLFYLCAIRKLSIKRMLLLYGIILFAFVGLYVFKRNIVSILGTGRVAMQLDSQVTNLLSTSYFFDRIRWFLSNIKIYVAQFFGKIFYLIASTMGVFVWGMIDFFKQIKHCLKKHGHLAEEKSIVILFLESIFVTLFLACCINGVGDTYANMFYGRYYEFAAEPLILIGIGLFFENKIKEKEILCTMFLTFITGMFTLSLRNYIKEDDINIDTNRLSGISYAIVKGDNQYSKTVYILLIVTMCFLLICILTLAKRWSSILIMSMLILFFCLTNRQNIQIINDINKNCSTDMILADYMVEHWTKQEAYFIYEPYKYDSFYHRIQVFVKEYPIHVIFPDELSQVKKGDFIITYIDSEEAKKLKKGKRINFIMQSRTYELFVK